MRYFFKLKVRLAGDQRMQGILGIGKGTCKGPAVEENMVTED